MLVRSHKSTSNTRDQLRGSHGDIHNRDGHPQDRTRQRRYHLRSSGSAGSEAYRRTRLSTRQLSPPDRAKLRTRAAAHPRLNDLSSKFRTHLQAPMSRNLAARRGAPVFSSNPSQPTTSTSSSSSSSSSIPIASSQGNISSSSSTIGSGSSFSTAGIGRVGQPSLGPRYNSSPAYSESTSPADGQAKGDQIPAEANSSSGDDATQGQASGGRAQGLSISSSAQQRRSISTSASKPLPNSSRIAAATISLLASRGENSSICPSEVARKVTESLPYSLGGGPLPGGNLSTPSIGSSTAASASSSYGTGSAGTGSSLDRFAVIAGLSGGSLSGSNSGGGSSRSSSVSSDLPGETTPGPTAPAVPGAPLGPGVAWRDLMPLVRKTAVEMVEDGSVVVTQGHGASLRVVDLGSGKVVGPIRLRRGSKFEEALQAMQS